MSDAMILDEWMAIADGRRLMPPPFQRFIAAWEVIVSWHRNNHPEETTDRDLKRRLKERLIHGQLDQDAAWCATISRTLPWHIDVMRGSIPSGHHVEVTDPADINAVVDALYTVRCNLLKAGKSPNRPTDLVVTDVAAEVTLYLGRLLYGQLGQRTRPRTTDSNADSNLHRR